MTARILDATDPLAIREAAITIQRGGLVAFPTETVYGLGADACNPIAVARVFEVKGRPLIDPLILHVADRESAQNFGKLSSTYARALMERFWPGPLTLVVPKRDIVPPIVTAGLESIALRMPAQEAALALIRHSRTAIAAPSANLFGQVSPTDAGHVSEQLSEKVDLILDGGPCRVGVESTIVSLVGPNPCLLRTGGTPVEELEEILGKMDRITDGADRPQAPGQFKRHYATRTRLEILPESNVAPYICAGEKVGILALTRPVQPERYSAVEVLSSSGDLREAAANLFAALHRLDKLGLDRLVAQPVPEIGLGIAIMDRLRRCSAMLE